MRTPARSFRRCQPQPDPILIAGVMAAVAVSLPAQLQFARQPVAVPGVFFALCLATGDIDGDGDLDLAVGFGGGGQTFRLLANDGRGGFTDVTPAGLPPLAGDTLSLALGDVDGDGDLDLVLGSYALYGGAQNRLLINDGTGAFTEETASRLPVRQDRTAAIALGDVDGDGDLDVIEGNGGYYGTSGWLNRLLVNDGSGVFTDVTASQMPNVTDMTNGLAVGDVDGDGDLDLVFGNGFYDTIGVPLVGEQNRLLVNDGTGTFSDVTATQLPIDDRMTMAVALGDVDGDGDLDLVAGNDDYVGGVFGQDSQNALLLNDGVGGFTNAVQLPIRQDHTRAVALSDLDEDGDAEILFGNIGGGGFPGWSLLDNDGTGAFTDVTAQRFPGPIGSLASIAVADIDGDGDRDLIDYQSVARNLLRQLDAPVPPRIGQPYTLDFYSRYGPSNPLGIAVLSPASATIPSPFGAVGVDLTNAVTLPFTQIPQPAGLTSASFTIPSFPALLGTDVFGQALIVDGNNLTGRLTNVTADVIQ